MNDDFSTNSTRDNFDSASSDIARDTPQTVGRRLGAWRPADELDDTDELSPDEPGENGAATSLDAEIYDGTFGNARHEPPPFDMLPHSPEPFELSVNESPQEAPGFAEPPPPEAGDPFAAGESDEEKHEKELDLMEHLRELRSRILRSFAAVAIAMVGTWHFRDPLLAWFARPIVSEVTRGGGHLRTIGPMDGFTLYLQITFVAAIIIAIPIVIYQVWAFVVPALTKHERRYGMVLVPFSVGLFFIGAFFGFYLTPLFFRFLIVFTPPGALPDWSYSEAASFLAKMLLVFGVCFQVPVVSIFLNKIGLVSRNWMIEYWRHVVTVIFIIVAIITPTWDPVTLCAAAVPPCLLYGVSIWMVKWL